MNQSRREVLVFVRLRSAMLLAEWQANANFYDDNKCRVLGKPKKVHPGQSILQQIFLLANLIV